MKNFYFFCSFSALLTIRVYGAHTPSLSANDLSDGDQQVQTASKKLKRSHLEVPPLPADTCLVPLSSGAEDAGCDARPRDPQKLRNVEDYRLSLDGKPFIGVTGFARGYVFTPEERAYCGCDEHEVVRRCEAIFTSERDAYDKLVLVDGMPHARFVFLDNRDGLLGRGNIKSECISLRELKDLVRQHGGSPGDYRKYIHTSFMTRAGEPRVMVRRVYEGELKQLGHTWKTPPFVQVILYSQEQIAKEREEIDASWGIVTVKGLQRPQSLPIDPITAMRNRVGIDWGGSGAEISTADYSTCVDFWEQNIRINRGFPPVEEE